jgi:dihydrofolate reductase
LGKLIYSAITSLDGYISDEDGNFDWAMPDEEVHGFANDLDREIGTHLYGRRMYETMVFWETAPTDDTQQPQMREYAEIWQAAEKIVYSTTLQEVASRRTRLERAFEPDAVRRLKAESQRDLTIGGPDLAAHALRAGLVDEVLLFLTPIVIGGGNAALPDGLRLELELLDERRFANGMLYLRYRTRT